MKKQWKKTGFWFLMVFLSICFMSVPYVIFIAFYSAANFLSCFCAAVVTTFDRKARHYRYHCGTLVLITIYIAVYFMEELTKDEPRSWDAVADVMMVLLFVPVLLLTAKDKYKKGKKEYEAEMLLNGGDIYE
ncbi:MAG: hypothetical protein K6G33_14410 [Ruminococcus sp.]|uniref:hypothetical protein n=1 Tax=Ruminococcus sp. TaxID=41978 RepID=UPI0025CCC5F9|nr:hypothetical protein [Ruminococcus sp.]MCR5601915.1 hypothetical protein [Ruminococcus sp.]